MPDDQKRLLEKQLWAVADTLRSSMNADEYRNYILGFIFYKYLSEKQVTYADTLLKADKLTFADLDDKKKSDQQYIEAVKSHSLEKLGFFLSPNQLFSVLVKKGKGDRGDDKFILEDLKAVLNSIEQTSSGTDSEDDFKGLFADVDLTSVRLGSSEKVKNERVVEILAHLSKIDFKLEDSKSDVLGDAYEYLIAQFAAGAGKKAGEFYTPSQVSRLMAMIVTEGKKKLRSVYDPTCGSGSLLLRLGDYANITDYYGQEYNTTTYNLARMNMILHGVHYSHFKIENGNTLTDDKLPDLKAEAVVANPPFSAKWKGDADPSLVVDERFSQYGRLAPKGYADFAFVTHMIHHLADNGVLTVILPHGALSRPDAEQEIRKYIIEKQNYIDAVIGLPENLFFGAELPAIILVCKKCRKDNDDVYFIDGSTNFERGVNKNYLSNEQVDRIFDLYKERKNIDGIAKKASLEEIRENNFNLNISRYISKFSEENEVSIKEIVRELQKKSDAEAKIRNELSDICKKNNIPLPEGSNVPLLKQYKKAVIHQLYYQKIKLVADDGNKFSEWKVATLDTIFQIRKETNSNKLVDVVLTNSATRGVINQRDYFEKDIANKANVGKYQIIYEDDFVYNPRTSLSAPVGPMKRNKCQKGVMSPLYTIFEPIEGNLSFYEHFFESTAWHEYMYSVSNYGARHDRMNIRKKDLLKLPIPVPSKSEQKMIARLISLVDDLIENVNS